MVGKYFVSGAKSGAIILALWYVVASSLYAPELTPYALMSGGVVGAILGGIGGLSVGSIFSKNTRAAYIGGAVFVIIFTILMAVT